MVFFTLRPYNNLMNHGFFITGTSTGVGKTIATAVLLKWMQAKGLKVGVMKPVETGVDPECHSSANSDARFLMEAGGIADDPSEVCAVRFKTPASPFQAGRMEDSPLDPEAILSAFEKLKGRHDWMLVEGVGGLMVPLTEQETVVDLVTRFQLPLILVASYTLGTQNHTLLTIECAQRHNLEVAGLIFNKLSPEPLSAIELEQPQILCERTGLPLLAELPYLGDFTAEDLTEEKIGQLGGHFNFDSLVMS